MQFRLKGKKAVITCPHCQNKEFEGAIYCSSCGNELYSYQATLIGTRSPTPEIIPQPRFTPPPYTDIDHDHNLIRISLKIGVHEPPIPLVGQDEFTLGRSDERQTIVPDIDLSPYKAFEKGVSRLHATIKITENEITFMDLGSANGSRLNGRKATPNVAFPLRNEDVLILGRLEVQVIIH